MTPDPLETAEPEAERYMVLRLYVAGDAPNSSAARANLKRILNSLTPTTYEVEVVDCLREPLRAIEDGVVVTPTLLLISPPPRRTVIGSLSEAGRVSLALGIDGSLSSGGR